jgi:hypothetical protein
MSTRERESETAVRETTTSCFFNPRFVFVAAQCSTRVLFEDALCKYDSREKSVCTLK